MAIPTTQKECTTRRIASLIIGLWDKVKNAFLLKTSRGSANGVASLDANSKVPSSQLPTVPIGNLPVNSSSSAGIVASGSGQQNRVWGTDLNGNPSWSTVRANMLESNINISGNCLTTGRNLGTGFDRIDNKRYKYLGKVVMTAYCRYGARFQIGPGDGQRNCDILLNVQRNTGGSGSATQLDAVFLANTEGVHLSDLGIYYSYDSSTYTYYFYLGVFNNLEFVRCIFSNGLSFDAPTTTPSSLTRIANNHKVILGPTNSGVGSTSVPVYADSNGVLQPCTNVPVIEHVTAIPVDPVVGTIYAL